MKKYTLLILTILMIGVPVMATSSLNFKFGLFQPNMKSDLWEINMENLVLDKADMQGKYYGLEYEFFVNKNFSLALEAGYYKQEHLTFYKDVTYTDDSPIYQNVALETTSMDLDFKFYPLGNRVRFMPYIGGGGTLLYWFYEQWGDIVDFETMSVEQNQFLETEKYSVGVNAKAGFVFRPVRNFGISVEAKYLIVKDNLSSFFEGFEKFDLSGWQVTAGINILF